MMRSLYLVASLLVAGVSAALHPPFPVPTGKPVPGDYSGPLRPQIHFSPPRGFMNDPNGLFYLDGTWHLYYQYNPTDLVAGNQHWGHATSRDLYHWENQPIVLFPANESSYIFSGSCVVDEDNTSGFFPNQKDGVVAIYTIATYKPIELQTQGIAYSRDQGKTFTPYKANPVLDVGSSQFRDPKVIWYKDHWVMVIAYAAEFTIGIYTSKNLKQWDHASNFTHSGVLGQYECPNLVEIPVEGTEDTMWGMFVSINPGSPLGGSITQYFLGEFDGYEFTPMNAAVHLTDFAQDNYAGQFFYNAPGGLSGSVSIAWASNWLYTQSAGTAQENWRSSMSLPRQHSIRPLRNVLGRPKSDYVVVSKPYNLKPVLGKPLATKTLGNDSVSVDFSSVKSNALYFEAKMTNGDSGNFTVSFSSPVSGESLQAGAVLGVWNPVWINRGGLRGFDNVFYTDKFFVQPLPGTKTLSGVIDRSVFELFVNNGLHAGTATFFPKHPLTVMKAAGAGLPKNAHVELTVWPIKSVW